MAVVYVFMYFKCKICFTVYTGETKINDTYLLIILLYEKEEKINILKDFENASPRLNPLFHKP